MIFLLLEGGKIRRLKDSCASLSLKGALKFAHNALWRHDFFPLFFWRHCKNALLKGSLGRIKLTVSSPPPPSISGESRLQLRREVVTISLMFPLKWNCTPKDMGKKSCPFNLCNLPLLLLLVSGVKTSSSGRKGNGYEVNACVC